MVKMIRIGTRDSQLAKWQAEQVQSYLSQSGYTAELVYIKSEGDIDLKTPLYEMGVEGIFTRSLDTALLNNRIDIAVHSMKDVPTKLPGGIIQAAVLKRGPVKDLLVYQGDWTINGITTIPENRVLHIATSSIRRKAQWLRKYPDHQIHNLRGNIRTRLNKLSTENWDAAIFAQAGLERLSLRPENSIELDWMLPAPAQGAILVACRDNDNFTADACGHFNDADTEICTKVERDFLKTLLGGCTTPISAYAEIRNGLVQFKGNILSVDGTVKLEVEMSGPANKAEDLGVRAANQLLKTHKDIIYGIIRHARQ